MTMTLGIRERMLLSFGLLMIITVTAIGVIDIFGIPFLLEGEYDEHRSEIYQKLNIVADLKKERLERWLEERRDDTFVLSRSKALTAFLAETDGLIRKNMAKGVEGTALQAEQQGEAYRDLAAYFTLVMQSYAVYNKIHIHDAKTGRVIISTDSREIGKGFQANKDRIAYSNYHGVHISIEINYHITEEGQREELLDFHTSIDIRESDVLPGSGERVVAVLYMHVNPDDMIKPMLHTGEGVSRTGEALLIDKDGRALTSLKHPLADGSRPGPLEHRIDAKPAALAAMGKEGIIEAEDYRGVPVLAAYRHIRINPYSGWGMVVKIDRDEVFAPFKKRLFYHTAIAVCGVAIAFVLIIIMSNSLTRPILKLRKGTEIVGGGDLDYRVSIDTHDEIGELSRSFDRMTENLKAVTASRDELDNEISERKSAELELKEQYMRLEDAKKIARLGHWELDIVNNVLEWSDEVYGMFGLKRGDFGSDFEAFLATVHPDDKENVLNAYAESVENRTPYNIVHRILMKDGTVKYLNEICRTEYDENGRAVRSFGTAQDITELNRAEEALKQESDINSAMAELSSLLLVPMSIKEISVIVLEIAKRLTGSKFGFVGHIDPETGYLVSSTLTENIWDDCRIEGKEAVFKEFTGLWGWVLKNKEPLMTNNPSDDLRSTGVPEGHVPIERFLSVPALIGDRVLGQIALANPDRDYTQKDLMFAERLAAYYAIAIQRREAEEALRESEENYRNLVEHTHSIHWGIDLSSMRFTYVSPQAEELLGYPVSEWTDFDFWAEHIHPDDRDEAVLYCKSQTAIIKDHDFTYRMIASDGRSVWLHDIVSVIAVDNVPVKLTGIMLDITELKNMEHGLRKSEERLRALLEKSPVGITLSREGIYTFVNKACSDMFGYESQEELIGTSFTGLIAPPYRDKLKQRNIVRENGGKVLNSYESVGVRKNGEEFPFEVTVSTIDLGEGLSTISFIHDITERKRAEEAVHFEKSKLENIVSGIDAGLTVLDPKTRIIWANDTFQRWFGPFEDIEGHYCNELFKHENPQEECSAFLAMKSGEVETGESFVTTVDGAKRHFQLTTAPIKDNDGNIVQFVELIQDVTERKRMEEELLLAEQLKLRERAQREWQFTFDSITDIISIHDSEHNIIRANQAFRNHFGLEWNDIIYKKCYEIFHQTDSPHTACPLQCTIKDNSPQNMEYHDPKTDKVFQVSTFPFNDPDNEFEGIIHITRDITDIREKEMRLVMSERLASLGQMASGIAHEINNPLSSIAGCSEGLLQRIHKDSIKPEFFEKYLHIINEEVFRCKDIVKNMLSFAQKSTYSMKAHNINDIVEKSVEMVGYQGRLKSVEVIKDYSEDLPSVMCSEGELKQVLLIIISNALDAMKDSGTLTVKTATGDKDVSISITDTGPGIPQDHLSAVFNPFFTTKEDDGGVGLGLSIAHKIVTNHNGNIDIVSREGKGTTFKITLPL